MLFQHGSRNISAADEKEYSRGRFCLQKQKAMMTSVRKVFLYTADLLDKER